MLSLLQRYNLKIKLGKRKVVREIEIMRRREIIVEGEGDIRVEEGEKGEGMMKD